MLYRDRNERDIIASLGNVAQPHEWKQSMDVRTRDWECACGHKWTAPIELTDQINQNIKGEKTVLCPKCNKKPLYGSQAKERHKWMSPPPAEPQPKAKKAT